MTGERNVTYAFEGSMKRILQIFIPVPIRLEIFVPIPIRFLLIQLPDFHLLLRQLSLPFSFDLAQRHWSSSYFVLPGRSLRYWDFFPYESYSTGDVDGVVVAFELLLEPLPAFFLAYSETFNRYRYAFDDYCFTVYYHIGKLGRDELFPHPKASTTLSRNSE